MLAAGFLFGLSLTALSTRAWATPDELAELPPPRAVHAQPALRWQRNLSEVMSGPRASTMYRDTATALDVEYRLWEWAPSEMSQDLADRALELALGGVSVASELSLRQLLADQPVLDGTRRVGRMLTSPAIQVPRGQPGLHMDDRIRTSRQALEDVTTPGSRGPRPPPPLLATGVAWRLDRDDEDSSYEPVLVSWFEASGARRGRLRAEADWRAGARGHTQMEWTLAVRAPLRRHLSLVSRASGANHSALPLRWNAGLEVRLPTRNPWFLQGAESGTRTPHEVEISETRWTLTLRSNLRWHLPVDVDRWPLGQVPGRPGPWLPRVDDHGGGDRR